MGGKTGVPEQPIGRSRATETAIAVTDLRKIYPGSVRALDGVSFTVEPGAVFGLLGPNGAGKSTTVKILTTLSRADGGTALVDGIDVAAHPELVRRAIGCVAQKSGVDLEATGRENLILQGRLYGLRGRELKRTTAGLLERFGLAGAGDRVARTYSGGMQRKLDVAMGLIHRPRVLFLDEPTTGLDPEARADMWDEIARLSREEGLTILLTTHYLEEADRLARRLAIVDYGRIVAEGTPDGLKGELRGDAIHIELAHAPAGEETTGTADARPAPDGKVHDALNRLGTLREIILDGHSLRARADSGAAALPGALTALDDAGVTVASATVTRPSLDDVYLRHTGRAFSSEGHDAAGPQQ